MIVSSTPITSGLFSQSDRGSSGVAAAQAGRTEARARQAEAEGELTGRCVSKPLKPTQMKSSGPVAASNPVDKDQKGHSQPHGDQRRMEAAE